MLLISLVNGILVDCVSNLLIAQSTIHYRSILLLTTTILLCPSESISPVGIGFCFVVLAQLYQGATRLEQNTARLDNEYTCGRLNRLTAHYFGYELLAIGDWL